MAIRTAILTVSDRSFHGLRPDTSGPALAQLITDHGWQLLFQETLPDDRPLIEAKLIEWCDQHQVNLILTTGGTGFAPRDITPEATLAVIEKNAPGLVEAMRASSLQKTPHAMLSRAVAGIRSNTLIVNLPGNPTAAVENLEIILSAIPHAIQLLSEDPLAQTHHHID